MCGERGKRFSLSFLGFGFAQKIEFVLQFLAEKKKKSSFDICLYSYFSWMHMAAFDPVKNKSLFVLHRLKGFYVNNRNSDIIL